MEFSFQLKNDGMVESSLECVSTETEMERERHFVWNLSTEE
jgi:hypothetical protein